MGTTIDKSNIQISVLMSVYNEPVEWLHESIDSILNQTYTDFEFIIICDNPGYKKGIELLEDYRKKDDRIIIVYNEQNIGLTKSLNKGLDIACGKYIARMDADDIAYKDRFEQQINKIRGKSYCLCHSGKTIINENNQEIREDYDKNEIDYSLLFLRNIIAHPTVMFTADIKGLRSPLYNEQYKRGQDYELWSFLFLNKVDFVYIPRPLLYYRESESQISRKHVKEQWHNSQQIRTCFVSQYLSNKCIHLYERGLKETRKDIIKLLDSSNALDVKALGRILFLVDFTSASYMFFNIINYHRDKHLFGELPSQYTKMIWQASLKMKEYPYLILSNTKD